MPGCRLLAVAIPLVAVLAVSDPGTARADKAASGIMYGGAAFLAYSLAMGPPQDDESDVVTFGSGVFDVHDVENPAGMFRVEYRPALWAMRTGPLFGMAGTTDGGILGYGGLRHDIAFTDSLLVSFNSSLAAYPIEGNGKDLGSAAQFRTGFDVHYKLDDGSRIGVSFHHISHAELFGDDNPGTETLGLTYTIPIGRF
ncbi:MAG: acyloxyacyl hydrolase [Defluviicoccus sp.]|nr:acyloxyacyl hydrolase [Defluviicoccus sp.]